MASDESQNRVITRPHVVKGDDLNHHHTLYGGRCVEWAVQTAYITAANCFDDVRPIVFMSIRGLSIRAPVRLGEIVQFTGRVEYLGESIIGIGIEARKLHPKDDPQLVASGSFLFCTVNEEGKAVAHGLQVLLPQSASTERRWKRAAQDAAVSLP